jgi:Ca2+/Na+ antiporter
MDYMVGERIRTLLLFTILGVTLLMVLALYTDSLAPSGVTGLATILLVLVTVIYTLNTREQARATRASYSPSLDLSVYPESQHLTLDITNRGEGVARDITIRVQVGEHEYHGHITDSLSPGERLYSPYGPDRDRVVVVPRFYEPRIERREAERTPPRRALKQGEESPLKTMVDVHGSAQLTLPELLEIKQQVRRGWTAPNGDLFVPFNIDVTYTDVTESNSFVTESPDFNGIIIRAQTGTIRSILTGDKGVTPLESRWHKFKRQYLRGRDIAPYKETLDTSVRRRLSE